MPSSSGARFRALCMCKCTQLYTQVHVVPLRVRRARSRPAATAAAAAHVRRAGRRPLLPRRVPRAQLVYSCKRWARIRIRTRARSACGAHSLQAHARAHLRVQEQAVARPAGERARAEPVFAAECGAARGARIARARPQGPLARRARRAPTVGRAHLELHAHARRARRRRRTPPERKRRRRRRRRRERVGV